VLPFSISIYNGITSYEDYKENGYPTKRVDLQGASHYDKAINESIPTPHVQEFTERTIDGQTRINRGPIRPASEGEIPSEGFQMGLTAPGNSENTPTFDQRVNECAETSMEC
jgi:Bacterial toxin 24